MTRMSRREAIIAATQALAASSLACKLPFRASRAIEPERFQRAFRTPPIAAPVRKDETTDYYEIAQTLGTTELRPGARTTIWGFDGMAPGPTIVAQSGRRVLVRQTNQLNVQTAIHLHGGATPSESDGFPTDLIRPGGSREYSYPNEQPAATLWFHDHSMHTTGRNVYMGLSGLYVIRDAEEQSLGLPDAQYDVPLLLQQRSVDEHGQLSFDPARNLGATGDIVTVNGVPAPRMEVANRKYRFRIVNGANATVYRLALSSGRPLHQIATDGGLLPAPVEHQSIRLAMAERVEVVVDFAPYPIGTRIILKNLDGDGRAAELMCFDVVREERDASTLPNRLASFEPLREANAVRTREFVFAGGPESFPPHAHWTINGHDFDAERPIVSPQLGDVEIWRLRNRRRFGVLGMVHPVHVHLVRFQILDRDGRPPGAHENGWKDTVAVAPGEDVRIISQFAGHRGRYLIHCHNLEHEDHRMMARYDVV